MYFAYENTRHSSDTVASDTKKIAIIPHRGPDGDAMGSTLGLYHFY
jgi:phosphoesterase RecJ-like protein